MSNLKSGFFVVVEASSSGSCGLNPGGKNALISSNLSVSTKDLVDSSFPVVEVVEVSGVFGLNNLGGLGLSNLKSLGKSLARSSCSMLDKMSSMRLLSVVVLVVDSSSLNPAGKNFDTSSWTIEVELEGLLKGEIFFFSSKSFGSKELRSSVGMLESKSLTVGPLLGRGLKPLKSGLSVVVVVGSSVFGDLGVNLLSLFLKRFARLPVPGLLVLLSSSGVTCSSSWTGAGSSVASSGTSVLPNAPRTFMPSLCLKRSAKDLGLNVVVVLFGIGGKVRIRNRLSLVVVGGSSVIDRACSPSVLACASFSSLSFSCCWILAQGSKLDWSRSSSSLMSLTAGEEADEVDEGVEDSDDEDELLLDLLKEVETLTLTLG